MSGLSWGASVRGKGCQDYRGEEGLRAASKVGEGAQGKMRTNVARSSSNSTELRNEPLQTNPLQMNHDSVSRHHQSSSSISL